MCMKCVKYVRIDISRQAISYRGFNGRRFSEIIPRIAPFLPGYFWGQRRFSLTVKFGTLLTFQQTCCWRFWFADLNFGYFLKLGGMIGVLTYTVVWLMLLCAYLIRPYFTALVYDWPLGGKPSFDGEPWLPKDLEAKAGRVSKYDLILDILIFHTRALNLS